MNEVKIQWLGHSCFCMEYRKYSIPFWRTRQP